MITRTLGRDSSASFDLDFVRGVSALIVLVGHWRNLFFVAYQDVAGPTLLDKAIYFLTGYGHQAVMVFFVLSGFLVGSGVVRSMERGEWSWSRYAVNRFTRLYVVLVPALLCCWLLDRLGMAVNGIHGIYAGGGYNGILPEPVADRHSLVVFLGNLAFVQTILVPTFGSNGPLWSLANEFWYYVLFPLLWVFAKRPLRPDGLLAGAALIAGLVFVRPHIAWLFGVWLMGAALAFAPLPSLLSRRWIKWLAALGFAAIAVLIRFKRLGEDVMPDYALGICFATWLGAVLVGGERPRPTWYRYLARYLSERSYTLYLTHLPLLVFAYAVLVQTRDQWQPSAYRYALAGTAPLAAMLYAEALWRLFEAKTDPVRRALTAKLLGRTPTHRGG
ncbi:MAG: acyltransferase family protein [Fimbriimonadaceae bacterium]